MNNPEVDDGDDTIPSSPRAGDSVSVHNWGNVNAPNCPGPAAVDGQDNDRAIIHLDMASFYAQCEELRDPILATLPLGIQQKQIIVTCNYVARARGVGKLMLVTDALRTCPDLVIRSGEDLTYYRSISDKIYWLVRGRPPPTQAPPALGSHLVTVPLPDLMRIERLGLDELFIDTARVPLPNALAAGLPAKCIVIPKDACAAVPEHLVHATHWALAIQSAIQTHLNLTCSIGVGTSKLAAKLASGFRKPDGLGLLLPEAVADVLAPMHMGVVPGLGYRVRKVLVDDGLVASGKQATVGEVRDQVRWPEWIRVVGGAVGEARAKQVWEAIRGLDSTPVVNTSHPTQISTEDSFRPGSITSRAAFDLAARHLVALLLARYRAEAHTHSIVATRFRLSVRLAGDSWARKSASVALRVPDCQAQYEDKAVDHIMDKAVKGVADRLVGNGPMDLTLINVAFTNLEPKSSSARNLDSFFSASASTRARAVTVSSPVMVMVEHDEPPDAALVLAGGGGTSSPAIHMQCPICNEPVWPWVVEVHLLTHNVSL
ncbi:hypothetical protein BCR44DRAFT_77475 [Catenaria anguillulae PL171]|uniref:UmuC domain-containing protein n=1 Tax=Catenaria anguillulae PL171 TaxID=765915 RepID=A0A1Y2HI51_9FUNG|nr:hypothetical protein BCR44DRAFT_77475 [Catenaria anguillulae PL171]